MGLWLCRGLLNRRPRPPGDQFFLLAPGLSLGEKQHVLPWQLVALPNQFVAVGSEFFEYIRDTFDCLYREGDKTPRMMTIGLHARLLGRPGRIGALHRILDYMLEHDRVWICRREEIARYWAENHPYQG